MFDVSNLLLASDGICPDLPYPYRGRSRSSKHSYFNELQALADQEKYRNYQKSDKFLGS